MVAQLSPPDMRLPIQYALTYPSRLPCPAPALDRQQTWDMSLIPVDADRFPALELGFEVARVGGTAGVVLNGANEVAVPLFLSGKIRFTDMARLCKQTLEDHNHESAPSLQRLLQLDRRRTSGPKKSLKPYSFSRRIPVSLPFRLLHFYLNSCHCLTACTSPRS